MNKTGTIHITKTGIGFVDIGGEESVVIEDGKTGVAMSGDTVEVKVTGKSRGRPAGVVLKVEQRAKEKFVGTLEQIDDKWLLTPDDKNVWTEIEIVKGETKAGYKALAKFIEWQEGAKHPTGEVLEIIGEAGVHETEMRALVLKNDFELGFPADVEKEAKVLEEEGEGIISGIASERRDMRGTVTFTIDPDNAKDFDDAISIKKLEDGNIELGVHIADVSHFVKKGSAIDKEARKRATSIYLVDRTIPMLPEVLSNDLCSLKPNIDRLAFSAVFVLDSEAKIHDAWFGETIIHSDRRFTYEEAQAVLDKQNGEYLEELNIAKDMARKLREIRARKGAVTFETDEVKIDIDKDGKPVRIYIKERIETNMLIEDLMLLANESVATHMERVAKESGTSFVYRIHDLPNEEKLEELSEFLKALGYQFGDSGKHITGKDFNKLFEEIEGTPEEDLVKTTAIRTMSKAQYTTKNIGHFGLAMRDYTHFTSPIRRYPDIMVHRLMKAHISNTPLSKAEYAYLEEDVRHSTEREIAATSAERESIKLKQVEYMANHVGESFTATVTGVNERGVFVSDNETHSEGMVHVRNMNDDFYSFDARNYQIVGQRNGKKYRIGDTVKVRLVKANPIEKILDFVFI